MRNHRLVVHPIEINYSRNDLLTPFSKKTLADRYLLPNEDPQELFARVASAYADTREHAQRMYDYISKLWFMPATPVLSNGGTLKGLPISCFLNAVPDSMEGIVSSWTENIWLAKHGGGIGTYWGDVRSIDEDIKDLGKTSGVVPFMKVQDALTAAISQGSQRRGAGAVYMDDRHPEIEEFLALRKMGGDIKRKLFETHHGIGISDAFMEAVTEGTPWQLLSPRTGEVIKTIDARTLWQQILEVRLATGEPYLIFTDTASDNMPPMAKQLGQKVRQSNLCAEIMLHTGKDHLGAERTAVCCLSSANVEYFLDWVKHPLFVEDVMRFLDNVLQDFIDRAPPEMWRAKYSAMRERSVGLGIMGFHTALQGRGIAFESPMAKSFNMQIFRHLRQEADAASRRLAIEKGPCPDAADVGLTERFMHKLAVAPTATISIIAGGTSAAFEPIPANIYSHKTLSGTFEIKNKHLEALLQTKFPLDDYDGSYRQWSDDIWKSILENQGSVQHLSFLTKQERDIYKTAFELDQRWIIEMAADRQPNICQSQSVNVFIPGDIDKWDLHMLHYTAWEKGLKSLYYLRSKSMQRASFAGSDVTMTNNDGSFLQDPHIAFTQPYDPYDPNDNCLACQ